LRPLTCRILVGLLLGGDPAATRVGCATARMPRRIALRARGWPSVVLERAEASTIQIPSEDLAVPPANAQAGLALPTHPTDGAFFAPSELGTLPGSHSQTNTLSVRNTLSREVLIFVDDLAVGWVGVGATANFVNLSEGRHLVRARSLDGLERSHTATVTRFPAEVTLDFASPYTG